MNLINVLNTNADSNVNIHLIEVDIKDGLVCEYERLSVLRVDLMNIIG